MAVASVRQMLSVNFDSSYGSALIQSFGTDQLRLRKSFCLLTSESDCLRKNFNNATQMSLFDVIKN